MALGYDTLGGFPDRRGHMAVVVHEGAVNIQRDHEFVLGIGLVIDASNCSISQNSHGSSRTDSDELFSN